MQIGGYEKIEQYDPVAERRYPGELASVCMVFEADDGESTNSGKPSMSQQIRQPIVDKLRAADLLVREELSRDRDEMFVLISASDKRQRQVAEIMGETGMLKLRLRQQDRDGREQKNEGAWTPFKQHLQPLYEPSSEGSLFSSAQQLQILEFILNSEDERAMGPHLVLQLSPGNRPLDQLQTDGFIKMWFRLHKEDTKAALEKRWVWQWKTMQPIEAVREYFGEKIALYFLWIGYYTTMLWIPAICGIILTISQVYSHIVTDSMDNPWVPLYCCFITVWAIIFISGWKRVERTYQYEWDTLTFEDEEEDRKQFIQNKHTRTKLSEFHTDPVRYPDETMRNVALCVSAFVVCGFICAVIAVVSAIALFKFRLIQKFEPYGMSVVGKGIGSGCQAVSIMFFNKIYQRVLVWLTDFENWQTETQYEDATIAKDFCFKIVNAYFACFFVAFVQNNILVWGVDLHCPMWHCMPELTGTLAGVFIVQMTVVQTLEVGLPIIKGRMRVMAEEKKLREQLGDGAVLPRLSPEEEQSKLEQYEGVFSEYQEMVVQFGYVTLFAAAFPLTAALALINNMIEIRTDAYKLLCGTQRPPPKRAADIGTWMVILDILATCAILTNCALVGFTSHGLFFYFPDMTPVERVWVTLICEHALLVFKAVLDSILNMPPKEALSAYERRCYLRDQILAECQFLMPEDDGGAFYTDDEGDPYYGAPK